MTIDWQGGSGVFTLALTPSGRLTTIETCDPSAEDLPASVLTGASAAFSQSVEKGLLYLATDGVCRPHCLPFSLIGVGWASVISPHCVTHLRHRPRFRRRCRFRMWIGRT
jgi:hypothetical protein